MHRQCPQEFQDQIDAAIGTNPYGEPLFRLAWGQSETMRAGGAWLRDGFVGYRDILVSEDPRGPACWMIMMWEGPEVYRSPEFHYAANRDGMTGLQDLGEYPYHGRYRLIHRLMHREMVNGKLITEAMELNSLIIDIILPMTKMWQSLTAEAKRNALRYEADLKDQQAASALAEQKASYAPAFKGAVSFTGQGCRTSLIAKKEELIYKHWDRLMWAAKHAQRGFHQV